MLRSCVFDCLIAAFMLAASWGVAEEPCAPDMNFGHFSTAYVTPHTTWAKPWHAGAKQVVFLAPGNTHREAVELAQRLDLDIVPIDTYSPSVFAGPSDDCYTLPSEDVVMEAAETALAANWDAIVVGRRQWDKLPLKFRYAMLSRVHDKGAGLVLVRDNPRGQLSPELEKVFAKKPLKDAAKFFEHTVPYADLPYFNGQGPDKLLRLGEFGKGRILMLTYPGDERGSANTTVAPCASLGYSQGLISKYRQERPDYDFYLGLVARCVAWATRTESAVAIAEIGVPAVVERAATPLSVAVKLGGKVDGDVLAWRVRDGRGELEAQGEGKAAAATVVTLPVLKAGDHYLDLWLRGDKGVDDWASVAFNVRAPATIAALDLKSRTMRAGESVAGSVAIGGDSTAVKAVSVQVLDCLGRLAAQGQAVPKDGKWVFELPIPDPVVALHTVVAQASDDRGVLDMRRQECSFLKGDDCDEFRLVLWAEICDPVNEMAARRARELGVDTIQFGAASHPDERAVVEAQAFARLGFMLQPTIMELYFQHPMDNAKNLGISKMPTDAKGRPLYEWCFRSPKWQKGYPKYLGGVGADPWEKNPPEPSRTMHDRFKALVDGMKDYGVVAYNLGDEVSIDRNRSDACFCPDCERSFRGYVKGLYPDLATLNREWGTAFATWDDVTATTAKEAQASGQWIRWAQHRRHMELGFSKWIGEQVDYVAALDPNAKVGAEGISFVNAYTGFDIPYLFSKFKMVMPYDGRSMVRLGAQLTSPGSRRGTIYGTYSICETERQRNQLRKVNWDILGRGMNYAMFWHLGMTTGQGGMGIFTPTLDLPVESFATPMAAVREIKAGVGRLVLQSARADDGVRVLLSQSSVPTARIAQADVEEMRDALSDVFWALEDAGISYQVITEERLAAGALKADKQAKALILVRARAMSAAQSQSVLDFARGGGLVVTDIEPAIMTDSYRKLPGSSLAELFPRQGRMEFQPLGKGGGLCLGGLLDSYTSRRNNVKQLADGRTVAADQPAARDGSASPFEPAFTLARALGGKGGVKPRFQLLEKDGTPFAGARGYAFVDAGALFLVVIPDRDGDSAPSDCVLRLERPAQIYDVRNRRHEGETDTLKFKLAPGVPVVFAALPCKVESVVARASVDADRVIRYDALATTSAPLPRNVFHLELLDAAGKPVPELGRNLTGQDGKAAGTMQLPLNAPAGDYTLRATDVASGVAGEAELEIKEAK